MKNHKGIPMGDLSMSVSENDPTRMLHARTPFVLIHAGKYTACAYAHDGTVN